jgi:general secretion pathway protein G
MATFAREIMNPAKTIAVLFLPVLVFGIGAAPRSAECRISSTRSMIQSLKMACETFKLDTGQYPSEEQGLSALITDPGVPNWDGPYIRSRDNALPTDAWGHVFRYRLVDGKPLIDSCGPDGIFGTQDDNGKNSKPKSRTTGCSPISNRVTAA